MVPRSSLSNHGYVMTNSIGIIDQNYRASFKVTLTKVDPTMPDLVLPFRGVQILLKTSTHFLMKEADTLDDTERGVKGFGEGSSCVQ